MKIFYLSLIYLVLFFAIQGRAQKKMNISVTGAYENTSLPDVLTDLEVRYPIKFSYIASEVKDIRITAHLFNEPVSSAMNILLERVPFYATIIDEKNIVIGRNNAKIFTSTKRLTVSGVVTDAYNQPLTDAEVYMPLLKKTGTTDSSGLYRITNVPEGNHLIRFRKSGYYNFSEVFEIKSTDRIDIKLTRSSKYSLNESSQHLGVAASISLLDKEISLEQPEGNMRELLAEIERKAGFSFSYNDTEISLVRQVRVDNSLRSVRKILSELFAETHIEFIEWDTKIILKVRKAGAQKFTISGTIRDKKSGENLPGANVVVKGAQVGVSTNAYGFYSLTVPEWDYSLLFSYIGYKPVKKEISLTKNLRIDIELEEDMSHLHEVVVTDQSAQQNVENVEMSTATLDMKTLKAMPAFMGETDLIRSIIMLPGITTVGEGATGFNVRGGGVDQNLVLLDEAQVYNSSHLFGFFSVFNADAVKESKIYKGGIPALYGGRLSSVLDVTQKEGNDKKIEGAGGIGVVASRLSIEGPIVKNKGSFIIAGRRTYTDVFFKNQWLTEKLNLPADNVAYFYDLNAKLNYVVNNRNRIFASGYFGRDSYRLGKEVTFAWGNSTGTFRWNHLFNDKLFFNATAVYSNYDYNQGEPGGYYAYNGETGIINYNLKSDFSYYVNAKHKIDFGVSSILYQLEPGKAGPTNDSSIFVNINLPNDNAIESALYVSDEYKLNSKITLYGGLRYAVFTNIGPGTVYSFEQGEPRTAESLADTLLYKNGQQINNYGGFEPRLSAKVAITKNSSLKFSYNRMRQYIHMVSNTTAATPLDVWKASNRNIKPQVADQFVLGYFRNLRENTLEASVEVYYKKMTNLVDYRNGGDLILNAMLDADLLQGRGKAYGVEFMINKKIGRLTGWTSYTYSRTLRKVQAENNPRDEINNGDWYPSNYDQPHKINVVALYQVSRRINISSNFTYNTGRPATYPDAQYVYFGTVIPHYSNRNLQRIPDYHRMDFSATLQGRGNKWWKGSWTFSIYNLYGRKNAYSVFFRQVGDTKNTETVKLSIIGSMIPSLTYNFKF